MRSVSVVIPFDAAGDAHRDRAVDYVRVWWREFAVEVIVCSTLSTETWSKGRVVDRGVEDSGGELLVIADADCVPSRVGILAALRSVETGHAGWAQPHGPVWRLSEKATARLYAGGTSTVRSRRASAGPPGGGCVVLSRAAYETTGGIDPRFEGWGGEDISWARALDTLVGRAHRGTDPLVHLFHLSARPTYGRARPESEALAGRYYDAAGDVETMSSLVDEFRLGSAAHRESR